MAKKLFLFIVLSLVTTDYAFGDISQSGIVQAFIRGTGSDSHILDFTMSAPTLIDVTCNAFGGFGAAFAQLIDVSAGVDLLDCASPPGNPDQESGVFTLNSQDTYEFSANVSTERFDYPFAWIIWYEPITTPEPAVIISILAFICILFGLACQRELNKLK